MVKTQPNVEVETKVSTSIFHVANTTTGQGRSSTPIAVIFCLGTTTTRWAGPQLRSRPPSRNLARVTICEERWSGQHTQTPTAWYCLDCGSTPNFSFESGTQAFCSLRRVYGDAWLASNSVDDGFRKVSLLIANTTKYIFSYSPLNITITSSYVTYTTGSINITKP